MFNSKALKNFPNKKRSKFYLWWIENPVVDWFYKLRWKLFDKPLQRIKKIYGWNKNVFWQDYDFDAHGLFAIIEYKLKRVEKCLINGHVIQEDQELHAIRLAIKLAGRLKDDRYEDRGYDRLDQKFGPSKHWFEPCNDGTTNSYMHSSRPKVNTEEEKQEENEYRKEQWRLSEYRRNREKRWLYAILHKYLATWWD